MTLFIAVICIFLLWFLWMAFEEGYLLGLLKGIGTVGGALALMFFGAKSCTESEWYQAEQRENAAACEAARQPRVINRIDACETYAFKPTCDGQWKYFVRCPGVAPTTTDNSYSVRSGKTTRQVEDSIEVRP